MENIENKKQTENPYEQPVKKRKFRHRRKPRFTPRIDEITTKLQDSFPKLFTRRPDPKVALKIGIRKDLLSWATENNITEDELGRTLANWCCGRRYKEALKTKKRYDLDLNETPFTPPKNHNKKDKSKTNTELFSETIVTATTTVKTSNRKKITYPENWEEVYPRWKNKEISFKVAMELLGLKQSTFYRLAKEYTSK